MLSRRNPGFVMAGSARHDAWSSGDSYELYMGRWSRRIAERFLDLVAAESGLNWVEVGCGTGALSSTILRRAEPASLTAVEPSESFRAAARASNPDPRASFVAGDAQSLPLPDASADILALALVLNFIPDRARALEEMRRVLRPGGRLVFYVWDYPGGGVGFIRAFWTAAVALDPSAAELTETGRFPFCTAEGLTEMVHAAGFRDISVTPITDQARFDSFADFWRPFTLGAGPAPGYCASLADDSRERLRQKLADDLVPASDGSITLPLRAWAVQARS
jgi:ubiquinone/menaquinone biosynthesis C-methylase UbiE